MRLADILRSKDGSMSLTKLSASTAHLLMAAGFLRLQVFGDLPFDPTLWGVYGGFAIAHAGYDKTLAVVKDFKDRQLDAESAERPTVAGS